MKATDYALHQGTFLILHKNIPHATWVTRQVLVTYENILFFESNQNMLDPEIGKLNILSLEANLDQKLNKKFASIWKSLPMEQNYYLIKVFDKAKKTIKFMACNDKAIADNFCLAVSLGSLYSYYQSICSYYKFHEHESILKWILMSLDNEQSYFNWIEDFFTEAYFVPAYELIKNKKIIKYFAFDNALINIERSHLLLQILGNFSAYQIIGLKFTRNKIDDILLDKLSNSIAYHEYLQYLEISNNSLTDESLMTIASILENLPSLVNLILNNNKFEGRFNFAEFIESVLTYLKLDKLDLSYNALCDDTIDIIISHIYKQPELSLKMLDISFNRYSKQGFYRLFNSYYYSINKNKLKVVMKPIPFNGAFLKFLVANNDQISVKIERTSIGGMVEKRTASKISDYQNIDRIYEMISSIETRNLTIEEIANICGKIYKLEYEFPPQKLDYLYYILKENIEKALETNDSYCLSLLISAANKVGLQTNEYDEKILQIINKIENITRDLLKVLNFEYPENQINKILDEKIEEALKYGLRGNLIDTILWIKESRDEAIKRLHKENYKDGDYDALIGPYAYLEKNKEYADKSNQLPLPSSNIPNCLLLHPVLADYHEMSHLTITLIQKYLKEAIEHLKQKENYYMRNVHNRCYFFLTDNSTSKTYKLAGDDKKLYCSRLVIQYKNYVQQKIEKKLKPIKLTRPIESISLPEDIEEIKEVYAMNKFQYLRELDDFNNKLKSKIAVYEKGSEKKQYNFSYKKSVSDPLEYFAAPTYHSLINFINKNAEEYAPFISSALYDLMNIPLDQEEYSMKLHGLMKILIIKSNDEKVYDELFDECYMQIYRFTNTDIDQTNQKMIINMYAALMVITYFIFPSSDLLTYIKAWIYKVKDIPDIKIYCEKILLNILNAEHPDFVKPEWIPSKREIEYIVNNNGNLKVEIKLYGDEKKPEIVEIPHYSDIDTFMQKVYSSHTFETIQDKYNFWAYKISKKEDFNQDHALHREERIVELWSKWEGKKEYSLVIKRRIYSSIYTLNIKNVDDTHFELFYENMHAEYFHKNIYTDYLKIEDIVNAACLLFLMLQKKKKTEYKISKEKMIKYLKDIIPNNLINKKSDNEWCVRMTKIFNSNLKWYYLSLRELQEEFLKIFHKSCMYASSIFEVKKKDNISFKDIPLEAVCAVNIFGIFFLLGGNKDRPIYVINYEEIVYILGYDTEIKIAFISKVSDNEIRFTIHCERAREFAEDVISYAQLRTLENNKVIYAFPIIRDMKTAFFDRRKTLKSNHIPEVEHEITEEDRLLLDNEIENLKIVAIQKAELAYHQELPFFYESQKNKNSTKKPFQRVLPKKKSDASFCTEEPSFLTSETGRKDDFEEDKEDGSVDPESKTRKSFWKSLIPNRKDSSSKNGKDTKDTKKGKIITGKLTTSSSVLVCSSNNSRKTVHFSTNEKHSIQGPDATSISVDGKLLNLGHERGSFSNLDKVLIPTNDKLSTIITNDKMPTSADDSPIKKSSILFNESMIEKTSIVMNETPNPSILKTSFIQLQDPVAQTNFASISNIDTKDLNNPPVDFLKNMPVSPKFEFKIEPRISFANEDNFSRKVGSNLKEKTIDDSNPKNYYNDSISENINKRGSAFSFSDNRYQIDGLIINKLKYSEDTNNNNEIKSSHFAAYLRNSKEIVDPIEEDEPISKQNKLKNSSTLADLVAIKSDNNIINSPKAMGIVFNEDRNLDKDTLKSTNAPTPKNFGQITLDHIKNNAVLKEMNKESPKNSSITKVIEPALVSNRNSLVNTQRLSIQEKHGFPANFSSLKPQERLKISLKKALQLIPILNKFKTANLKRQRVNNPCDY